MSFLASASENNSVTSFYETPKFTEEKSFYNCFLSFTKHFGEQPAMTDPQKNACWSYAQLRTSVNQMSQALNRIGIQAGDIIGTYVGNSPEYITFCVAATGLGATVLPLNPAYKPNEIQKYFSQASVHWILIEQESLSMFHMTEHFASNYVLIVLDDIQTTAQYFGLLGYLAIPDEYGDQMVLTGTDQGGFIFYSSGTSGPPKGVVIGSKQLIANIEIIRAATKTTVPKFEMPKMSENDVVFGVLPYFHVGGLLTTLCMLSLGTHIIVNRKFDKNSFFNTIAEYKVSILNVVPSILQLIDKCNDERNSQLASLKYIFVGAAKVDPQLNKRIRKKLGIKTIELYGSTETGVINFIHPVNCDLKEGSCGILLPGVKAKILDLKDERVCRALQIGELWLQTPTLMRGYLERTDQKRKCLITKGPSGDNNDWYQTGDLAYFDEENFFYITGRVKEMIKVRGWQVSPYELEEELLKIKGIAGCAVTAVQHTEYGQIPRAYIVLEDEAKLTKADINTVLGSKLSSYKQLVGGIEFVKSLPKTASGKVAKHLLNSES